MKNLLLLSVAASMVILLCSTPVFTQDGPISPSIIKPGVYHGLSAPLKDLPVVTEEEFQQMVKEAPSKIFNQKARERTFPYASSALPRGSDPVWQKEHGKTTLLRDASLIFDGLVSPYWPTDANGTVGHNYYMQTINCVFAIYDKASGALVAGPTFLNHLFSGVIGSECNSGDPVVIYDEQEDRWVATVMSICGPNDYVLIAVSASSDPTGSWYKYSFDVDDVPDYEKISVWKNGYYMATNNGSGEDIFAFEREVMLAGGSAPAMVGFDNPWRPVTPDGFHYVPPIDNDGAYAPDPTFGQVSPALFITMNDDAVSGGNDELWIYELNVDWSDPDIATFNRVQQISVPPFDSDFGPSSDAIPQPSLGTNLDALPNVIMHRAQYRNFIDPSTLEGYETIVCCHTVDINNNDNSGIRWYELRRENGSWSLYQSGTYAPVDGLYRWMGEHSYEWQP